MRASLLALVLLLGCEAPLPTDPPVGRSEASQEAVLVAHSGVWYTVGAQVRRWAVREEVDGVEAGCERCVVTIGGRSYWVAPGLVVRMIERTPPSALIAHRVRVNASRTRVFFVGGQSNAAGVHGLATLDVLRDSLGMRSAWPSYADEFNRLTGLDVATSYAAVGGSAQVTGGSPRGDWGQGGTLLPLAFDAWVGQAAPLDYVKAGVLWSQGERDANRVDNGRQTIGEYAVELDRMLDRLAWRFPNVPVLIFRTGRKASGDTPGWAAVRAAQDATGRVVYDGTVTFPDRGLMLDEVHYSPEGLDEMGRAGARAYMRAALGL